ncbi:MAG: DEAD/DEAH box helicase [Bacteroidota bacterium]|nr:DEAD/DEAH box helicase [Bacteroidota bacterium]
MTFEELDLEEEVLDGLWAMNFHDCTPVQEQSIPILLEGKDLIACAQTGTGKTAAYLLPILNNLVKSEHPEDAINAIVMVPTRELAQQIDQQIAGFGYYLPVSSVAVYGGSDGIVWEQQKKGLQAGVDIVIATPGRLLSYLKLGLIDLSQVQYFILDEADRMLDMGFFDDIMQVVNELPKRRQTMLFSATMPGKIRELAKTIMIAPAEIRLAVSKPNENIIQSAYICYERQKAYLVKSLFTETLPDKVLIFASSKIKVREVTRTLRSMKLPVAEMHSDLDQSERDRTMQDFRSGKTNILVATDIVSRGIDIEDISVVINYDVPHDAEDYVHRIGRTARASAEGLSITFVSEDEQDYFERIEKFLGKSMYRLQLPQEVGEGPEWAPSKHHGGGFGNKGRGRNPHKKRNS